MNIIGNLLCCELTDLFDTLVCLARFIDATHEVIIQQNTYDSVHTNVKVDKAHSTATKTLQTCIATQRKIINLFVLLGWENTRKPTLSCGHCWAALRGCVVKGHTSPHKLSPWRSCGCCPKWRSCDCENYVVHIIHVSTVTRSL